MARLVARPPSRVERMLRWTPWLVFALLALAAILYVLNPFGTASSDPRARVLGFAPYRVASSSMEPTLRLGEFVLMSSAAYRSQPPRARDLVVFRPPHNPDQSWLGRVIALPGQRVQLRDGIAYVDDVAFDPGQPPAPARFDYVIRDTEPLLVEPGRFFMLGDNRDRSEDSRYWGTASLDAIEGRVTRILWSEDGGRIGTVE